MCVVFFFLAQDLWFRIVFDWWKWGSVYCVPLYPLWVLVKCCRVLWGACSLTSIMALKVAVSYKGAFDWLWMDHWVTSLPTMLSFPDLVTKCCGWHFGIFIRLNGKLLHWLERGNLPAGLSSVSTWWLECAAHRGFLLQTQRCLTMSFLLSEDYNQTYHNNINPAQQTLYQQFDCPVPIPPLSLVLWGLPFKKGSVLKRRRYMKSSTETRLNKDKQACCLGKPLSGVSKRRQWK